MGTLPDLPLSKAFLSSRTSIAWLPSPPSEPTVTRVLTGSKWYIDLRVSKTPERELVWGMAGVKEIVGGTRDKPRARFTNHLDSQQPELNPTAAIDPDNDAPLPDEGDFILLPSGQTLESGSMLNPDTGLIQPYEEIWSNVYVPPGEPVLILVRRAAGGISRPTAFVGIIGCYALSLWQDPDSRSFGAWMAERPTAESSTWVLSWSQRADGAARAADIPLPEGDAWHVALSMDKREGDKIVWAGDEWEILERGKMGRGRSEP